MAPASARSHLGDRSGRYGTDGDGLWNYRFDDRTDGEVVPTIRAVCGR